MTSSSPADWQLPQGVSRGLWDYLRDPGIAQGYDSSLSGSLLCQSDVAFVERHCPTPGRLLDLGCGTGRLLLHFAQKGYWTLGADLSSEMLKVALEKAQQENVSIQGVRLNLTDLSCLADESFDYAACLFSTLGMVQGADLRRRACVEAFRVLRRGGRFLLHVHNLWHNLWDRKSRRWLLRHLLESTLGRSVLGDCAMPAHQGIGSFTLHLFRRREALRLLRSVGFRILEIRPLSITGTGFLKRPWWFGKLRAYGYLIAAERSD